MKFAAHCIRMKEVWRKSLNTENHDVAVEEIEKWQQQLKAHIFGHITEVKIRDGAVSWNMKVI
jgi:hypothetical protein